MKSEVTLKAEKYFYILEIKRLRKEGRTKGDIFSILKGGDDDVLLRRLLAEFPEVAILKKYKILQYILSLLLISYICSILYVVLGYSFGSTRGGPLILGFLCPLLACAIDACYCRKNGLTLALWNFFMQYILVLIFFGFTYSAVHVFFILTLSLNFFLLIKLFPYFTILGRDRKDVNGEVVFE